MSFNCDSCGYQNNEIQSGGKVQDRGVVYKVKIVHQQDLSRQLVKSDYASLSVPQIDLEIPPNSQKGSEYVLSDAKTFFYSIFCQFPEGKKFLFHFFSQVYSACLLN